MRMIQQLVRHATVHQSSTDDDDHDVDDKLSLHVSYGRESDSNDVPAGFVPSAVPGGRISK